MYIDQGIIIQNMPSSKFVKKAQNLENVKAPETFTDRELTRAIRDAIVGEENAIKQYEAIVDAATDDKIKGVIQDIANEEKVHVGELLKLLSNMLPDEQGFIEDGQKEVEDANDESTPEPSEDEPSEDEPPEDE